MAGFINGAKEMNLSLKPYVPSTQYY